VNQLIIHGYAVKTLESKETKASKEITVTHNSVFAAHRLQCRMTTREDRHPAFCFSLGTSLREIGQHITQVLQTLTEARAAHARLQIYRAALISSRHCAPSLNILPSVLARGSDS
jgi:hypothetical protein